MLNKKDLHSIEDLIQKNIKNALQEFFETLILPYFEHNEEDHEEMKKILRKHDERFDSQDRELDLIQRKLERNRDEHDEMFQLLDKNGKDHKKIFRMFKKNSKEHNQTFERIYNLKTNVADHEKRIGRLETVVSS